MSKRFIISESNIYDNKLIIAGADMNHINALRHKVGDKIYVNEYEVEITHISKEKIECLIIGNMPSKGEPNINITLVQSYLKSDKMEYVVQKAVELGVKKILPTITKNTVVKFKEQDKLKKQERLQRIAKEALQQCGRTDSVNVEGICELSSIDWKKYDSILICHELSTTPLKSIITSLENKKNIAVIIGPEGGLDNKEVEMLIRQDNVFNISLGDRILRAETASLSILSILLYELD